VPQRGAALGLPGAQLPGAQTGPDLVRPRPAVLRLSSLAPVESRLAASPVSPLPWMEPALARLPGLCPLSLHRAPHRFSVFRSAAPGLAILAAFRLAVDLRAEPAAQERPSLVAGETIARSRECPPASRAGGWPAAAREWGWPNAVVDLPRSGHRLASSE